jgi:hypothetical protein
MFGSYVQVAASEKRQYRTHVFTTLRFRGLA